MSRTHKDKLYNKADKQARALGYKTHYRRNIEKLQGMHTELF